jgi:hypothetical protein
MKTPPLPPLSDGARYGYDGNGNRVCLGARMGRYDTLPDPSRRNDPCKLRLVRLAWIDGAYDAGGAYWGQSYDHGNIYRAVGDCGDVKAEIFTRAKTRTSAKASIRALLPAARFYR